MPTTEFYSYVLHGSSVWPNCAICVSAVLVTNSLLVLTASRSARCTALQQRVARPSLSSIPPLDSTPFANRLAFTGAATKCRACVVSIGSAPRSQFENTRHAACCASTYCRWNARQTHLYFFATHIANNGTLQLTSTIECFRSFNPCTRRRTARTGPYALHMRLLRGISLSHLISADLPAS